MGETRVDLLHLLEDLRDAYPGSIEETILTEIMANALDSGATRITFECDPTQSTLIAVDNGCGMQDVSWRAITILPRAQKPVAKELALPESE